MRPGPWPSGAGSPSSPCGPHRSGRLARTSAGMARSPSRSRLGRPVADPASGRIVQPDTRPSSSKRPSNTLEPWAARSMRAGGDRPSSRDSRTCSPLEVRRAPASTARERPFPARASSMRTTAARRGGVWPPLAQRSARPRMTTGFVAARRAAQSISSPPQASANWVMKVTASVAVRPVRPQFVLEAIVQRARTRAKRGSALAGSSSQPRPSPTSQARSSSRRNASRGRSRNTP